MAIPRPPRPAISRAIPFAIAAFAFASTCVSPARSLSTKAPFVVRVCQNKDCRSRYPTSAAAGETLVRTFRDLIPPADAGRVAVEPSECLSQCGRGPNVAVSSEDGGGGVGIGSEKMYFGVGDVQTAGAILEVACDYDCPPRLLAAADVIARAGKASSPSKKISLLTSAIDALSSDPSLSSSSAIARVHALRADARLEADEPIQNPLEGGGGGGGGGAALDDAERAVEMDPSYGKAWRVLADAREAAGDLEGAVEAVQRWAEADPALARKARGEVERLTARM